MPTTTTDTVTLFAGKLSTDIRLDNPSRGDYQVLTTNGLYPRAVTS